MSHYFRRSFADGSVETAWLIRESVEKNARYALAIVKGYNPSKPAPYAYVLARHADSEPMGMSTWFQDAGKLTPEVVAALATHDPPWEHVASPIRAPLSVVIATGEPWCSDCERPLTYAGHDGSEHLVHCHGCDQVWVESKHCAIRRLSRDVAELRARPTVDTSAIMQHFAATMSTLSMGAGGHAESPDDVVSMVVPTEKLPEILAGLVGARAGAAPTDEARADIVGCSTHPRASLTCQHCADVVACRVAAKAHRPDVVVEPVVREASTPAAHVMGAQSGKPYDLPVVFTVYDLDAMKQALRDIDDSNGIGTDQPLRVLASVVAELAHHRSMRDGLRGSAG